MLETIRDRGRLRKRKSRIIITVQYNSKPVLNLMCSWPTYLASLWFICQPRKTVIVNELREICVVYWASLSHELIFCKYIFNMAKTSMLILTGVLLYSPGRVWRQRSRASASDAVQCYLLYDTIIGMKSHYYLIPHLNKTNTWKWIVHDLATQCKN